MSDLALILGLPALAAVVAYGFVLYERHRRMQRLKEIARARQSYPPLVNPVPPMPPLPRHAPLRMPKDRSKHIQRAVDADDGVALTPFIIPVYEPTPTPASEPEILPLVPGGGQFGGAGASGSWDDNTTKTTETTSTATDTTPSGGGDTGGGGTVDPT